MGNNLYDLGGPKRIIVEHEVRHTHELVRRADDYNGFCPRSPGSPGWTCEFMRQKYGACAVCPFRPAAQDPQLRIEKPKGSSVTITHEFIDEPKPKRLK
jgi:hypothetical protein